MAEKFWDSEILRELFGSQSVRLSDLIEIVGGAPATFLKFSDLRGVDLRGRDLAGIDFSMAMVDENTQFDDEFTDVLKSIQGKDLPHVHVRAEEDVPTLTELSPLPLCFVASAYSAIDILNEGEISPLLSRELNSKLVFLFYGRPSFRDEENPSQNMKFNWPFLFLIKPDAVKSIDQVYPFDTGAYLHGAYSKFFPRRSDLDDFGLIQKNADSSHLTANKIGSSFVRYFYNSNEAFVAGLSSKNLDIPLMDFETQSLAALVQTPEGGVLEIQTSEPIKIDRDSVIAIIMPQAFAGEKEVSRQIPDGIEIRTYETSTTLEASSLRSAMFNSLMDFYRDNDII